MKQYISTAWKTDARTNICHDIRVYLSPRGKEYPLISGTPTYTAITSGDNAPGAYNITAGVLTYYYKRPTAFTITTYFKPAFAYNVASDQTIWSFGNFSLIYRASTDTYSVTGTSTVNISSAYTTDLSLQAWTRITVVYTGSNVTGYVNGSATSSALSVAATVNNIFTIDATSKAINHVRVFEYAATATEEGTQFSGVRNNEIFFRFNRTSYGIERTNVTQYVIDYSLQNNGTLSACTASVSLRNNYGYFNDDIYYTPTGLYPSDTLYPSNSQYPVADVQYSYAPESGNYNGSMLERYLVKKIPLFIESWYGTLFEPLFYGYIPPNSFSRSVSVGGDSIVSISANDMIADMAKRVTRTSRAYDTYYLCNETNATTSLMHIFARLSTDGEVYNYATMSGFESASVADSWTGITRSSTQAFSGTYSGLIAAGGQGSQTISFGNLSFGETFTFSVYAYAAASVSIKLSILEYDATTKLGGSSYTYIHSGNGWERIDVTHIITDSDSTRLRISASVDGTTYIDNAMLTYGYPKQWYVDNTNLGTSGTATSSQAVAGTYQRIGINLETLTATCLWTFLKEGSNLWSEIQSLIDATIGWYFFIDSSNVLRYRSAFASTYASTLASIAHIAQVESGMQSDSANKLTVSGVVIEKKPYTQELWNATGGGPDNEGTNGTYVYTVLANGYWPDEILADSQECKYEQDIPKNRYTGIDSGRKHV